MSDSSTTYEVIIRPAAQRALRRVDRPIQLRLVNAMTDLDTDPRPPGTKALQGHRPLLRIRVGTTASSTRFATGSWSSSLVTLGPRSKVYDRL